jgi:ABC-type transporter Mla subunit MlaD
MFVAAALAGLGGLVLLFGRAPDVFSNRAAYTVLFPEAPGIGPGSPIRKSGVRIGEVTGLDLDPDTGQVRVQIRVDRKFVPRTSEDANITRGLLSGDTSIDFIPRVAEDGRTVVKGDPYPPGAEITGVPPLTPRTLLSPASNIMTQAQVSMERLVRAFEKLEKLEAVQPKLERALDEASETFKAVREVVPEAKRTLQRIQNFIGADAAPGEKVIPAGLHVAAAQPADDGNLRALVRDFQELVRSVRPAVDDVRGVVRRLEPEVVATVKSARGTFDSVNEVLSPENRQQVGELLKNVNSVAVFVVKLAGGLSNVLDTAEKALKNIDEQVTAVGPVIADVRAVTRPLAARSDELVTAVTESAEQLNKAIAEVRGLLQAFGRGNGTIQKLLADPTVYQNLDDAAGSLARVLARAEKIGRDLEVFADKVARRPELIGIGGVVRPSSGLKDAPGAGLPCYRPDWPPATTALPPAGQSWLPPAGPPPVQGQPPR